MRLVGGLHREGFSLLGTEGLNICIDSKTALSTRPKIEIDGRSSLSALQDLDFRGHLSVT